MMRRLGSDAFSRVHAAVFGAAFLGFALPAAAAEEPAKKDAAPAGAVKKITYDEHVTPIFREKCFGCHNADKNAGGLNLTTYAATMQGGGSGEVLNSGDADGSTLYQVVTHASEPIMPPNAPKMPSESLETIKAWIAGGALENNGSKPRVSNKPKVELALKSSDAGKPSGPPPMPGKLGLEPVFKASRANSVLALAASPWAPLVAVGGHKQVVLYHSETFDVLGVLPFPEGTPHVLKFSRNGGLLLAGGGRGAHSGKVVVWNVVNGERLFEVGNEFDVVLAADISLDQSLIALGGPSKIVRVYSTRDGELAYEIKKHTDYITALEFSPDGVLLASGDRNGGMFVWEAPTGREYLTLKGHAGAVTDVAWRPDSNLLASAGEDGKAKLWELENGTQAKDWAADRGVQSIRYAKDGRLATCGRDKTAKLWKADAAAISTLAPQSDVALRLAFSHDDQRLFVGDWSGEVAVYQAADGKLLGKLTSNPPTVAERVAVAEKAIASAKAALPPVEQQLAQAEGVQKGVSDGFKAQQARIAGMKAEQAKAEQEQAAAVKIRAESAAKLGQLRPARGAMEAARNQSAEALKKAHAAVAAKAAEQKSAEAKVAEGKTLVAKLEDALKGAEAKAAGATADEAAKAAAAKDVSEKSAALAAEKAKQEAASKALQAAIGASAEAAGKLAAAEKANKEASEKLAAHDAQIQAEEQKARQANEAAPKAKQRAEQLKAAIPGEEKKLPAMEAQLKAAEAQTAARKAAVDAARNDVVQAEAALKRRRAEAAGDATAKK